MTVKNTFSFTKHLHDLGTLSKEETMRGSTREFHKNFGYRFDKLNAAANAHFFQPYIKPHDSVLHFWSGGGYLLQALEGGTKIAVDRSPKYRRHAESLGLRTSIGFDGIRNVDVAISCHSLARERHPLKLLEAVRDTLSLDGSGLLVMLVPCNDHRNQYHELSFERHLFSWSPSDIRNLVSRAGFRVISCERVAHRVPPKGGLLLKIAGRRLFHLACRIYGRLAPSQTQILVVARRAYGPTLDPKGREEREKAKNKGYRYDYVTTAANAQFFQPFINHDDVVMQLWSAGGYLLEALKCRMRYGIEDNPDYRQHAIDYRSVDARSNADGIEQVDAVIFSHPLAQTDDPLKVLEAAHRSLRQGGVLVGLVPCYNHKNQRDLEQHLYSWSPMEIGNLVGRAGFTILSCERICHRIPPGGRLILNRCGQRVFNLACRLYGRLFPKQTQVRVVALKIDQDQD
jgi:SAM-dependent methyltransferase